jgi:hypothetical protein
MSDRRLRSGFLGLTAATALALSAIASAVPAGARSGPGAPRAAGAAAPAAPAATGQHLVRRAHRVGNAASVTDYTSNNWDGYFATAASHATNFTAVSATWTQAALTCTSSKTAWAGFWVGLDGWWNNEVEQGGSEARCLSGVPRYNVWWEMYPFNAIQTKFAIAAGDTIHASVTYVTSTQMFTIVVKDVTSGRTLRQVTPCQSGQNGCPRSTAEIISEDIGHFAGGLFPLPDYGTETYTTASVTDTSGHTGSLSDPAWQLGKVTEVSGGVTKQTTSALSPDGTSFTTTWHHA